MIKRIFTCLFTLLVTGSICATDFTVDGLTYTVINSSNKTCKTKEGVTVVDFGIEWYEPGNPVSGVIIIPDTVEYDGEKYAVTQIGKLSFVDCPELTSVVLPEGITIIDDMAFFYCKGLKSVNIPESVRIVGSETFEDCSALEYVETPSIEQWCRTTFRDYVGNPLYHAGTLIVNGTEITDLIIPSGVTSVSANSFAGFTHLKTLHIEDGVTDIGSNAFYNCAALEEVSIGKDILSSGPFAFYGCNSLAKVSISDLNVWCDINFSNATSNPLGFAGHLFIGDNEVTDIVLPENVGHVADYAFYKCVSLKTVSLPSSMDWIGEMAFYGCSNLESINLPKGLLLSGTWTFALCTSLTDAVISCSNLPAYTFYGCESLENVSLPSTLAGIGNAAFASCTSLGEIALPASLKTIGANAFYETALVNVVIPSGTIGSSAFAESPVETVTLGARVNEVGNYAFDNGFAPVAIFSAPVVAPTLYTNSFSGFTSDLFVPAGSMSRYGEGNWGKFTDIFALVEAESVEISGLPSEPLTEGMRFTLTATVYPVDVSIPYVTWHSTNPDIATVDNYGNVTVNADILNNDDEPCRITVSTLYDNGPIASVSLTSQTSVIQPQVSAVSGRAVYNLQGMCIKRDATDEDIHALTPGLYIIGGEKIIVR